MKAFLQIQIAFFIILNLFTGIAQGDEPEVFEHPNGFSVALFEDTRLPIVDMIWTIPSQGEWSPLLARLIERKLHPLETNGASIHVDADRDWTLIQIKSFSDQAEALVSESEKIIFESTFNKDEIKTEIQNWEHLAENQISNPDWALQKMMFPTEVIPNFKKIKLQSVSAIQKTYQKEYSRKNSLLTLIGRFPETVFSNLSYSKFLLPKSRLSFLMPERKIKLSSSRKVESMSGMDQVHIRLVAKAPGAQSPKTEALWIANTIIGGTPQSRLANRIRDQLGLTFGVTSQLIFRKNESLWLITTSTRKELSEKLIIEIHHELQQLYQKGVTEDEVEAARRYLKGSFPVQLATPVGVASQWVFQNLLGIKNLGLPALLERIDAVQTKDINQIIKSELNIKNWSWFVLTPDEVWKKRIASQLDRQLPSK